MFNKKILNVAISGAVTTLALQSSVAQAQQDTYVNLGGGSPYTLSRPNGTYTPTWTDPCYTTGSENDPGNPAAGNPCELASTFQGYDTGWIYRASSIETSSIYYGTITIANSGYINTDGGEDSETVAGSGDYNRTDAVGIAVNPGGFNVDNSAGLYGTIQLNTTGGDAGNPGNSMPYYDPTGSAYDGEVYGTGPGYIDAWADGNDYSFATGIYIGGSIQQSGLVDLQNGADIVAAALGDYAQATGIQALDLSGDISLSGGSEIVGEAFGLAVGLSTGINLDGDVTESGLLSIEDSAVIAGTFAPFPSFISESVGVNVAGDMDGTIDISGESGGIVAFSVGLQEANATALSIGGDLSGDLNISTGAADVFSVDGLLAYAYGASSVEATGLSVGGAITGSVANAGNIVAGAFALYGEALFGESLSAHATGMTSGDISGEVINAGVIGGEAIGYDVAEAAGLVAGDVAGELGNGGYIAALAYAHGDASAVGVSLGNVGAVGSATTAGGEVVDTAVTASLVTNFGEIVAYAGSLGESSVSYASAVGLSAGDVYGEVVNFGAIQAIAEDGYYSADAVGVSVGQVGVSSAVYVTALGEAIDVVTVLGNAGYIAAAASGEDASAQGISAGDVDGYLINSGAVSALAEANFGREYAQATGISVDGDVSGALINVGGFVFATALANDSATATARGLAISGEIGGEVLNSGEISAYAGGFNYYQSYTTGTLAFSTGSYSAVRVASATGVSGGNLGGSLTNEGLIYAEADAWIAATATGVSLGDISGDFTNSGGIIADAGEYIDTVFELQITEGTFVTPVTYTWLASTAYAVGLSAGAVSGTITNSGLIGAVAVATEEATAKGVAVGELSGELINTSTGIISAVAVVDATQTTASAFATGISVDGDVSGSIASSGIISVQAEIVEVEYSDGASSAAAVGVWVSGEVSGSVESTGTLSVRAQASNNFSSDLYASAGGLAVGDVTSSGSVSLGGTAEISAIAGEVSDDARAYATAIEVDGDLAGTVATSGTITVDAQAGYAGDDARAYAMGIGVDGSVSGEITNSADLFAVNAQAYSADSPDAYADGIEAGYVSGSITTSGEFSVSAQGMDDAYAYGIDLGDLDGAVTVEEGGQLQVSGESGDYARAVGIDVGDVIGATQTITTSEVGEIEVFVPATITNAGTIDVDAFASSSSDVFATAVGVRTGSLAGEVINSGAISVSATASSASLASAYAVGIDVHDVTGEILSSGSIAVSATAMLAGEAYAEAVGVFVSGEFDSLGDVDGDIVLSGTTTVSAMGDDAASAVGVLADDVGGMNPVELVIIARVSSAATLSSAPVPELYSTGSVENSGTLTVSASASTDAYAAGFDLGEVYGSVSNSGEMSVSAIASDGYGEALGMIVEGVVGVPSLSSMGGELQGFEPASLTNSGTLNVSAVGSTSANAGGFGAVGPNFGTIENSGSVTVSAQAADASALGMGAGYNVAIAQTTVGYTSSASTPTGIELSTTLIAAGSITNTSTGMLDVSASATDDADATGIWVWVNMNEVANAGEISVSAYSSGDSGYADAVATGVSVIYAEGEVGPQGTVESTVSGSGTSAVTSTHVDFVAVSQASVSNSGLIDVDASVDASPFGREVAVATGILVEDGYWDVIDNALSGVIDVHASAADAFAVGIIHRNDVTATYTYGLDGETETLLAAGGISNSGQILVSADARSIFSTDTATGSTSFSVGDYALAAGIRAGGVGSDTQIVNSGLIDVEASAPFYVTAYGIEADGDVDGDILNSGTVSVSVVEGNEYSHGALVHGIAAWGDVDGSIVNSGSVSVDSTFEPDGWTGATTNGITVDGDVGGYSKMVVEGEFGVSIAGLGSATLSGTYESLDEVVSGLVHNTSSGEISVSASHSTGTSDAYGYVNMDGLWVGDDVYGEVVNDGLISVSANLTTDVYVEGIRADHVGVANVNFNGQVASAPASVVSHTVYGDYDVAVTSAEVVNNGMIDIDIHAAYVSAADGIEVDDVLGTVANTGSLSVMASGEFGASARGIDADSVGMADSYVQLNALTASGAFEIRQWGEDAVATAIVSNSGTMTVSAAVTSSSSGAHAVGIEVDDVLSSVANSGEITVSASGTSYANATGLSAYDVGVAGQEVQAQGWSTVGFTYSSRRTAIYADEAVTTALVANSGAINVSASGYGARAEGIDVDDVLGSVSNSGTMTVSASGDEAQSVGINAEDVGIAVTTTYLYEEYWQYTSNYTSSTVYGFDSTTMREQSAVATATIVNSGTLTVSATASEGDTVYATGIYAEDVDGQVVNSGTIDVDAEAGDAEAYGIYVEDIGETGVVANTSMDSLHVNATATTSDADAWGIRADDVDGMVSNSGMLTVFASADSDAWAVGIQTNNIEETGSLTNSGVMMVTATAVTSDATAKGIYSDDIYGSVTNAGELYVLANGDSDAVAYGIEVYEVNEGGSVTNANVLDVIANAATSSATAYGIYIEGSDVDGSVTNSGSLTVLATSVEDDADAAGIYNDYGLSGSMTNAVGAVIDVTARVGEVDAETGEILEDGYSASALGMYVDDDVEDGGVLTNAGSITVLADAYAGTDYAYAYGIYVDEDVEIGGEVVNSGSIQASAIGGSVADTVYAYGVYVDSDLDGTLTNTVTGTINVEAVNDEDSAYAYGVYIGNDVEGTLENAGSITVLADASAATEYAYAYGIVADDVDGGEVLNSGTIQVSAIANTESTAHAWGIDLDSVEAGGMVTNSGNIQVLASGTYNVEAYGIDTYDIRGSVTNTADGVISVTAQVNTLYDEETGEVLEVGYSAYAVGIDASDVEGEGVLSNAGEIFVVADASSGTDEADAFGIAIDDIWGEGEVRNSGLISVTAIGNTESDAQAYGIEGDEIEGSLINSGTVDVLAVGQYSNTAYGIEVNSVTGSVVNTASGVIEVDAHSENLGEAVTADTAYAYGIEAGTILGEIINHGVIDVSALATGEYWAEASGISVDDISGEVINTGSIGVMASAPNNTETVEAWGIDAYVVSGDLMNSGTVSVSAMAGGSFSSSSPVSANAFGLQAYSVTSTGVISNSGELSVMASQSGDSDAFAAGIHVEQGGVAGLVENTGAIYVSAAASSATAQAVGIFGEDAVSGTIENAGTIEAFASGPEAYAVGIRAFDVTSTGEIVNSGTVLATATGSSGQAWGIAALNLDGAIVNSGYVAASGPDESWALYVEAGSGSISNATAGTIAGDFEIQASGVTFMNSGLLDLGYADAYHAGDFVEYGSGVLSIIVDSDDAADYGSLTIGGASNMMNADDEAAVLQVDISGFTTGLTGATVIEDVITFTDAGYDMSDDEYELDINETSYILAFEVVKDDDNTVDIRAFIDYDGGYSVWQQVQPTYWQTAKGVSQQFDFLIENPDQASDGMLDVIDYFVQQTESDPVYKAALANLPLFSGAAGHAVRDAMRETSGAVRDRSLALNGMSAGNGISTDKNLWIKPFASSAEQDATDGAAGYDVDAVGFVIGVDGELSGDSRLGVALSYTQSNMDSNNGPLHSADVEGWQAMAYMAHSLDSSTQLRASVDYGMNSADSMRDIAPFGVRAKGSFDVDSYHFGVALDRAYSVADKLSAVASVAVDYSNVSVDAYTETGAGALSQSYQSRDYTALVLGVEGELTYALNSGTSIIGRAGLGYDSENDAAAAASQFVGSGTVFQTEGIESDPLIGRVGVGLHRQLQDDLSLSFSYDVEARDGYTDQAASMKLRWEF